MCERCIDVLPSNRSRETRFPSNSLRHFYTLLQYSPNPVNKDAEGTMESVRIKRVELRENVRVFPRDKENCP